eukprot:TRINITY_DN2690_c0_g1_i10.p6 TRINITY_DN2690_c0_g1~~TRINITY_DN2690_c0_g1_i10.p6  ORF type:complete len:162 (-),score=7.03 TRINITY_DN2690_c0_g1_i10:810-1295(-)
MGFFPFKFFRNIVMRRFDNFDVLEIVRWICVMIQVDKTDKLENPFLTQYYCIWTHVCLVIQGRWWFSQRQVSFKRKGQMHALQFRVADYVIQVFGLHLLQGNQCRATFVAETKQLSAASFENFAQILNQKFDFKYAYYWTKLLSKFSDFRKLTIFAASGYP